jgi:hypothetical protein
MLVADANGDVMVSDPSATESARAFIALQNSSRDDVNKFSQLWIDAAARRAYYQHAKRASASYQVLRVVGGLFCGWSFSSFLPCRLHFRIIISGHELCPELLVQFFQLLVALRDNENIL